jgi:hypothetical protein
MVGSGSFYGLLGMDRFERHHLSWPKLHEPVLVDRSDGGNFWIPAGRLVIRKEHDRITMPWDLDRASHECFREHIERGADR